MIRHKILTATLLASVMLIPCAALAQMEPAAVGEEEIIGPSPVPIQKAPYNPAEAPNFEIVPSLPFGCDEGPALEFNPDFQACLDNCAAANGSNEAYCQILDTSGADDMTYDACIEAKRAGVSQCTQNCLDSHPTMIPLPQKPRTRPC